MGMRENPYTLKIMIQHTLDMLSWKYIPENDPVLKNGKTEIKKATISKIDKALPKDYIKVKPIKPDPKPVVEPVESGGTIKKSKAK